MAVSIPAVAQEAQTPEVSRSEIIVTARKRNELALQVPVIETVLSQEKIEQSAITTVTDIASFSPGVVVGESLLSVGTQVSMRGIGTVTLDPGVDQSIAMVIDGFSFTQGLAFRSGTFDLAQIEVLKGPQALFFGKSSPAGVISIRTADPGDQLEVIARAMYEVEARMHRGELIVSGPLSEDLGVRIAGQYHKSDGFFRNRADPLPNSGAIATDDRIGGDEGFHIRGTVLFEPDSSFNARLKLNYVDDYQEYPGAFQMIDCPDGTAPSSGLAILQTINPADTCQLDRNYYIVDMDPAAFPGGLNKHGGKAFGDQQQFYGTLEMNVNLPVDVTVTSLTGYYDLDFETYFNTFNAGYAGTAFASSSFYNRKEFTQEFRVNSDFSGPLNFTAGGFYQNAKIDYLQSTAVNKAMVPSLPDLISAQSSPLDIDSLSAFGQLRFRPVPQLELAAGGRYTHEKRTNINTNVLTGAIIQTANPRQTSNTFSPELTITYFLSPDMTLFASYKKGYKSGSYSLSRLPTAAPGALPDNSFEDEKAEGGEAGFKGELANGQLYTSIAGYYYEFSGMQFSVSEAGSVSGSLPTVRVVNAGSARVYGVDLETNYRPNWAEGLNLHGSLGWNDNKFTDLAGVPCYGGQTIALGCTENPHPVTGLFTAQSNLAGTPLPRAPKWSANFGFEYSMPMGNGWNLKLTNDNHYSSRQLRNLGLRDSYYQDEFIKVDAGLLLSGRDERWEVALIGKNIFNKITSGTCSAANFANGFFGRRQTTGGTTSGPDGLDEVGCIPERGRSVLLRLTIKPFN